MSNDSKNRTILHVDDDPGLLRIVAAQLEKKGYEVVSLAEPEKTLDVLHSSGATLVLLDIDMPGIDGLDLLKQVKQDDGGLQVIMLTGLVSMSTALRSLRWGAEACLFKPIEDWEPLLTAVEAAFDKIDRWWHCLEELRQRKTTENELTATAK